LGTLTLDDTRTLVPFECIVSRLHTIDFGLDVDEMIWTQPSTGEVKDRGRKEQRELLPGVNQNGQLLGGCHYRHPDRSVTSVRSARITASLRLGIRFSFHTIIALALMEVKVML